MSTPSCPRCGAELDPARAPIARVRGGRVLSFCSSFCADDEGGQGAAEEEGQGAASELAARRSRRRRLQRNIAAGVFALGALLAVGGFAILAGAAEEGEPPSGQGEPSGRQGQERASNPPGSKEADSTERVAERARAVLREVADEAESPLAPAAEAALARDGEERAAEALRGRLDGAEDPVRRIELAGALARAGVEEGERALKEELEADADEHAVRAALEIARAGAEVSEEALASLRRRGEGRLSIASALARLGDAGGARTLGELHRRGASAEERARAAAELGLAGEDSAREFLLEVTAEGRGPPGAGRALARLGEEAGLERLEADLALPSRRVRAAEELAAGGAREVDREPLLRALASEDARGQIAAAKALLILEGALD